MLGVFKYFLENIEMILAEVGIRVRYQETDQMGVVYHGNYFTWFEAARIELLDQLGCPYRDLEKVGTYYRFFTAKQNFASRHTLMTVWLFV